MEPSLLSKMNTAIEFVVLATVLADAAEFVDAGGALPALFALLAVSIVASGAQYVWIWGRKAALRRRAA
jgi:cardiolipin synthase